MRPGYRVQAAFCVLWTHIKYKECKTMKVVIVGGVAGGASAAARIRRLDEHAQITVFEKSGYMSYANCGLPYYIGGVIENPAALTVQTPESFYKRFRIDVKVLHEVTSVNPEKKTVSVTNLSTGESFEESYDKLVLSPGAKPVVPDMPGTDSAKIFTLRTVEDTFRIREFVEENQPKTAVMVGGGFISLEMAENLCEMGIKTTIVQRPDHLLKTIDFDMASFVHSKFRQHGVQLVLGGNVTGFEETGCGVNVLMKDREPLQADMVILAIGVSPDSSLAKSAGLELGMKGSIITNDRMETSVKDIYAVGDAVMVKHAVSGEGTLISLAGPANKQGRI